MSADNEYLSKDTTDYVSLSEMTVVGLYRNKVNTGSLLNSEQIKKDNYGEEPSFVFAKLPSIFAYNDAGTNFGYSYFRIRGMGQERMNVTLDGMPWNEAEDFGCYFSNSPDLMASMHSIKVERGASVTNNGTAAYAGNVSLESVNLKTDTISYFDMGYGSFNTARITGVYNSGVKNHWGIHLRGTILNTDGFKKHAYNRSQAFTLKTGYYFDNNHNIELLSMTGQHRNGQAYIGVTKDQIPHRLNPFKQIENGCAPQETDNFFMTVNKIQYNGKITDKTWITASVYYNHLLGDYRCLVPELWNYNLSHHLYGGNVVGKFYIDNITLSAGINAYMFQRRHIGTVLPTDTVVDVCHGYGLELYNNIGYKPDINIFGSASYKINKVNVTGNIQYRHTSLDYKVKIAENPDDKPFFHKWNFLNAGLGIEYTLPDNSLVYGRWALTHREPSRVDMFGGEFRTSEIYASTDAERVNDFEIGYDLNTSRINANINLFYMKFANEMVATGEISSQNGLPLHTQNNSFRIGIEASVTYNPVKTLNLIFNGALSANKIKTEDDNGISRNKNNTYSPATILYAEGNYTFKNSITVGLSANYHSKMYVDISNEHYLPNTFNLNAFVTKEWKHIDLSLRLNNITNRLNISSGYVADNTMFYMVDAPFNFYVNLKIKL